MNLTLVNLQGEGEGDEGSWHIHNAMRTEEGLFHPECHKDKDNGMDAGIVDSSMEEVLMVPTIPTQVRDPSTLALNTNVTSPV